MGKFRSTKAGYTRHSENVILLCNRARAERAIFRKHSPLGRT